MAVYVGSQMVAPEDLRPGMDLGGILLTVVHAPHVFRDVAYVRVESVEFSTGRPLLDWDYPLGTPVYVPIRAHPPLTAWEQQQFERSSR